jgi:hypothetical protein
MKHFLESSIIPDNHGLHQVYKAMTSVELDKHVPRMTRLQAGIPENRGLILGGFYLFHGFKTGSGNHPASYPFGTGGWREQNGRGLTLTSQPSPVPILL